MVHISGGERMNDIIKMGGKCTVNIDIEFESKEDYTQKEADELKQAFQYHFHKEISKILEEWLEYELKAEEFKVIVEKEADYFDIEKVTE